MLVLLSLVFPFHPLAVRVPRPSVITKWTIHTHPDLVLVLTSIPVSFLCPRLTRRDPRVPWSVFPRRQRACSRPAVSPEAAWPQRSSWSGWSATTRRWCASVRGTSATENASPPPPRRPPSAPPPPPGCPPAPLILHHLYVTPRVAAAAAAGTWSTTLTTAATPHSSPQTLSNPARMLTH